MPNVTVSKDVIMELDEDADQDGSISVSQTSQRNSPKKSPKDGQEPFNIVEDKSSAGQDSITPRHSGPI